MTSRPNTHTRKGNINKENEETRLEKEKGIANPKTSCSKSKWHNSERSSQFTIVKVREGRKTKKKTNPNRKRFPARNGLNSQVTPLKLNFKIDENREKKQKLKSKIRN